MQRLFNLLIILYPILSAYSAFAGLDVGAVLVFCVGLLCAVLYNHNVTMQLPKGYWPFILLVIFCSIVNSHKIPLWPIYYTACFIFAVSFGNYRQLLKYYTISVYICSAFFIIQEGLYLTTGVRISGFIPGLPLIYGGDGGAGYIDALLEMDRSSGFFLEPSYFAQYVFPFVALKLYTGERRDFWEAVIISIVLIILRSGNGTLLLAIIWGIWLWNSNYSKGKKATFSLIAVMGVMGIFALDPQIYDSLTSRVDELNFFDVEAYGWYHSGFIRFYRGYYLYADMPLVNKLFGASMDLIEHVRNINPYYFYEKNSSFLNGVQMLLVYYGLFACFLYLRHLCLFGKGNKDNVVLSLVICMIFLMFSESYLMTSRILLLTTIIYHYKNTVIKYENTLYNQ